MRRVMIVGQPGSGKSTLARQLGQRTDLPVHHMDHIHWMPGWVERPHAEKTRLALQVEAQETWIFEGGHSVTYASRAARADLILWLDVPLRLRVWRILRRSLLHRGQTRPDLPEGCPERFGPETLPFWRYVWTSRRTGRDRIARMVADAPPVTRVIRLTSLAEVRRFLDSLPE